MTSRDLECAACSFTSDDERAIQQVGGAPESAAWHMKKLTRGTNSISKNNTAAAAAARTMRVKMKFHGSG